MAAGKEIRNQIKGIKNTQKITSAMEMVAASKMRKAQDSMELGKPYARNMRNVVSHIANANPEYRHDFMSERPVKKVGYIVISTDRGLCGGLNINLFKAMVAHMKQWDDQGVKASICTIGSKASSFFSSFGGEVIASVRNIGEKPTVADVIGAVKVMIDTFGVKGIDKLYLVSNEFVNTMTQKPTVEQLLPLEPADKNELKHHWDYIYEPSPQELLDGLLTRYLESLVYQAVVENNACEQAARMIAMKNASDNAGTLIDELQLVYNKARQAAITQELSEIVGGASAV